MEENLWSISIDPDESMREYVLLQLKVRAMRDLLFRSRIFSYLAAATPGLKELVTIGKIWELAQLDRKVKKGRKYDLVIVDAPATGHGIGFLQTPRTFAAIARVGPIHSQAQTPRPLHHRPRAHRHRDRRPARGDAGQRVRRAGARPARRGRRRRRPRLHERPLPGALLQGRGGAPRRAGGAGRTTSSAPPPGRRSPSTTAPAPSAPSSPACAAGSRPRSRRCPSSSSPSWASRRRAGSRGGSADARARRHPRGQGHLHLRRLGRGRQDDDLGRDRHRDGGARAEGLRADDRPGEAARRLARHEGAGQRGEAGRPEAVRGPGDRDRGRAVGDDARREGDLRRAGRPPGARRGGARPRPRQPHLPADLQRPGRLAGVHGDGEAVRAAHRGPLRPARPRHPADPQRARLPRRAAPPHPVHRRALAAGLHAADRAGGAGRRARRVGRALASSSGSSAST